MKAKFIPLVRIPDSPGEESVKAALLRTVTSDRNADLLDLALWCAVRLAVLVVDVAQQSAYLR